MKITPLLDRKFLNIAIMALFLFTASMGFARDYIIFSIAQDIPMGVENEQRRKNYYVNLGTQQGVQRGTNLEVFRTISRLDPYQDRKRHRYNIKIGELRVLHAERESSISVLEYLDTENAELYTEINTVMIGDEVRVKVD